MLFISDLARLALYRCDIVPTQRCQRYITDNRHICRQIMHDAHRRVYNTKMCAYYPRECVRMQNTMQRIYQALHLLFVPIVFFFIVLVFFVCLLYL